MTDERLGEWAKEGSCKGKPTDLWFPTSTGTRDEEHARRVCSACPVREECAEYAIVRPPLDGIWGGLDQKERDRIRGRRRRGLVPAVDRPLPFGDDPFT